MRTSSLADRIKDELRTAPQGLTPRDLAQRITSNSLHSIAGRCSKMYAYGELSRVMDKTPMKGHVSGRATYFAKP